MLPVVWQIAGIYLYTFGLLLGLATWFLYLKLKKELNLTKIALNQTLAICILVIFLNYFLFKATWYFAYLTCLFLWLGLRIFLKNTDLPQKASLNLNLFLCLIPFFTILKLASLLAGDGGYPNIYSQYGMSFISGVSPVAWGLKIIPMPLIETLLATIILYFFSFKSTSLKKVLIFISVLFFTGCGVLQEKPKDPTLDLLQRPLTAEESSKLASEVGANFLYGQGLGEVLLNIGGIILWPPYAVYVLGNGIISLSGYQPLHVTNLLPNEVKDSYDQGYNFVTSGPGRFTATLASEEYRTNEVIKKRYQELLSDLDKNK